MKRLHLMWSLAGATFVALAFFANSQTVTFELVPDEDCQESVFTVTDEYRISEVCILLKDSFEDE